MAQEIQNRQPQAVVTPQHFVPPSPRELRAQSLHRLQLGLFGLAAMLLIVGLANIIMDRARDAEGINGPRDVMMGTAGQDQPASDPLADIGVVPAADPSAQAPSPDTRAGPRGAR